MLEWLISIKPRIKGYAWLRYIPQVFEGHMQGLELQMDFELKQNSIIMESILTFI